MKLSKVQQELIGRAVAAGVEVIGPTRTDVPGTHGIVVRASLTSKKLKPLEDAGMALTPVGDDVLLEMPRPQQAIVVYVPAPDHPATAGIARGSGIVGIPPNDDPDAVVVYYEGALHRQSEMERYADRVFHAQGRLLEKAPTIAMMGAPVDSLIPVGEFDPRRGEVIVTDPQAEALISAWLDADQLDPAELWRSGQIPEVA